MHEPCTEPFKKSLILPHVHADQVLARADALPVADAIAIREDAAAQLFGERLVKSKEAHSSSDEGQTLSLHAE